MKIAFLSFYSGHVNRGVETMVLELASRLSKNNDVTVFQSVENSFKTSYRVKIIPDSIDWNTTDHSTSITRRLFVDYWSLKIAKFTLKLLPIVWDEKFDIVIPLNGGWQPAFVRIMTWLYGGKMVISGQTGIGWDEKNNLMAFPNTYIGLNSKATKWAKTFNPLLKTIYIPNGVDLNRFISNGDVYKINLKKPIILAVGAFTEQKRMNLVIKAAAKMKDASLVIVGGGGDLRLSLEKEGSLLLNGRFEILSVPFEEMPKIYRSASVFTLPSRSSEAFGNVLVEAMASGLPVVATDDPIRKEIVGDAGLLVDPTNTKEYAKTLQKTLNTKWGDKPRKQAEKFSWDQIAEQYETLFKNLLNKK